MGQYLTQLEVSEVCAAGGLNHYGRSTSPWKRQRSDLRGDRLANELHCGYKEGRCKNCRDVDGNCKRPRFGWLAWSNGNGPL